jgi:phage tail protein X
MSEHPTDRETENLGSGRARALVGLRLDIVAKQLSGTERNGSVEAMLTLNPGLAADGPYAQEGRVIVAPERSGAAPVATVNPWD